MFLQISSVKRESYSIVLLNEERYKQLHAVSQSFAQELQVRALTFIDRVSHAFTKDLHKSVA